MQRSRFTTLLVAVPLALVLTAIAVTLPTQSSNAGSLPAAGVDAVGVSATVSVSSRLGQETIAFTGTASVLRSEPRIDNGTQVIDTEVIALELTGVGAQGTITASLGTVGQSLGQIRSSAVDGFPASSFFDVYLDAVIPASQGGGNPHTNLTVRTHQPVHLVSTADLSGWPPASASYEMQHVAPSASGTPTPTPLPDAPGCLSGVRLYPALPASICITQVALKLSQCPSCTPVPPTATSTATFTATATDTETPVITPTATATASGTPATPTDTPAPTNTPTATETPTPTLTPTVTPTPTITDTPTVTPTFTDTPVPTETFTPSQTRVPEGTGDASCNGSTDSSDALIVLQFDADLLQAIACAASADANLDGRADSRDAALILQFVARVVVSLPRSILT
jgi:hypothetical protein